MTQGLGQGSHLLTINNGQVPATQQKVQGQRQGLNINLEKKHAAPVFKFVVIFSIHFSEFPANPNLKSDEAKALLVVELSAM